MRISQWWSQHLLWMAALPGQFIALQVFNVLKLILLGYVLSSNQSYSFSTHFIEISTHVSKYRWKREILHLPIYIYNVLFNVRNEAPWGFLNRTNRCMMEILLFSENHFWVLLTFLKHSFNMFLKKRIFQLLHDRLDCKRFQMFFKRNFLMKGILSNPHKLSTISMGPILLGFSHMFLLENGRFWPFWTSHCSTNVLLHHCRFAENTKFYAKAFHHLQYKSKQYKK